MMGKLQQFWRDETAVSIIEYGFLILGVMALGLAFKEFMMGSDNSLMVKLMNRFTSM
jgi:Flp pilus assembly pilin Flp